MKFPEIKKTVKSFLLGEEGKISKQSMLKIGLFAIGGLSLSALNAKLAHGAHVNCDNCNSWGNNHANSHAQGHQCGHASRHNNNDSCGLNQHTNNAAASFSQTNMRITAEHSHSVAGANHCNDHGSDHAWGIC